MLLRRFMNVDKAFCYELSLREQRKEYGVKARGWYGVLFFFCYTLSYD